MESQLGPTERKYLLAVYLTLNEMGWTRLKKISNFLKVKMPSAKQFLEKLADAGLIYYEHRGGISLTAEGKKIAVAENARFNAVKVFFCEILQLSAEEADEAAWNIYFNLSENTVNKFSEFARFLFEEEGKEIIEKFRNFLSQPRKRLAPCPLTKGMFENSGNTNEQTKEAEEK
ncbi:metal-dependent transcriptional regulator [Fervidobacterium islandicum]|uniref:Manganese transport regulator n=1 Tax=Fervidobacterium islandicum TaxID=2423 RepID=A0AAI8CKS0_FERIS|nr:metal-dependent transcriptional regulator [Fervidobacterium islandicum]AMW32224.1 metal-dependent transcriptional regulator [Fervidobacterium islandicum]